jgi:predicted NUDIX family NTP pyrophosphohydrolase
MPRHSEQRLFKVSAGLVMYRVNREGRLEVLLVHPGGPFWAKKDFGSWTVPKGETAPGEDLLAAARREFEEELGFVPQGRLLPLGVVSQKGGKKVHAWAFEGDCNPTALKSNTFRLEWPPHSGHMQEFPEVDRAEFFVMDEAKKKINPAQVELLVALEGHTHPPVDRATDNLQT